MTRPGRIVLSLTLLALGVTAILALSLIWLYHHPATVKSLLEAWLSSRLEARVAIDELSYGFAPFELRAAKIAVLEGGGGRALDARIARLEVRCRLEGGVGQRTLVVERLELFGLSVKAEGGAARQKPEPAAGPPSVLNRLVGRLANTLLFRELRLEQVVLSAGDLDWDTVEIRVALHGISAQTTPGGIEVVGSARVDRPATGGVFEADRLRALLNPAWSAEREKLSGRIEVPDARYTGPQATVVAIGADAQLEIEFRPDHIALETGQLGCELLQLSGEGFPEIRVNGPRLSLSADYKRNERLFSLTRWNAVADEAAAGALRIKQLLFDAVAEVAYPVISIPRAEVRTPSAFVAVAGESYPIRDLALSLKNASFNADAATVSIPEISLSSEPLRNLKGSIRGGSSQLTVDAAASGMGVVAAAAGYGLLPPGWRISAADRLQAKAVWRRDGESTLSTRVDLSRGLFSNPSGSCVGEGLSLRADIGVRVHPRENAAAVSATARTTAGELLWEGIYLDLGVDQVALSGELQYARDRQRLRIESAALELGALLNLEARGSMDLSARQPSYDLALHMPAAPLAALFAALIAEPLRYRNPALLSLRVGGLVSADLNLTAQAGRRTARGRLNWNAGTLSTPDEAVRLEGIELDLPLWHESGSPGRAEAPMVGELAVRSLSLPSLPAQELRLPLDAGPGRLTAGPGMRFRFPSGQVRFDPVVFTDIFSGLPKASTRMTADRVHIGHLLKEIWPAPVAAVLNGSLEEIRFDGRDLRSRGRLTADIFGGKVAVDNPGVNGALGAAPAVGADISIEGLDLSELTRGTAFGRVQGVLSGSINQLEIVERQPQRFALQLETVRRKGVPQRITVAAVENIARIGGGQSPFVGLAGNLASLFKEFLYDKIGVRAVLENDRFRINGTVTEGGVEYLVRKGGIPGVDVVNLNPNNQISFRDMVKRVQRVADSESGPVVR
ncbi:MAG: hypothetical protein R6V84_12280 [Desulfobacterales bacterium]